jgi:SAM-dependent methyltransferase
MKILGRRALALALKGNASKKRADDPLVVPAAEIAPNPAPETQAPIWENFIALNSDVEPSFKLLGAPKDYYESDSRKAEWRDLDFHEALERDRFPLPSTEDREGYYGPDHFSYWASGLTDARLLMKAAAAHNVSVNDYLDLGCATGRVYRHFAVQWPQMRTIGCDINRLHVEWCNANLPQNSLVFQNHSIPSLPLPDSSVDLVSAFSVFTHIEALETAWLMELRRILRPGGIAWITLHSEFTLHEMDETWPLWMPVMTHPDASKKLEPQRNFTGDRMVLRYLGSRSYSSNVFYKLDYVKRHWGRIFEIAEVRRRCPSYQDVLILKKGIDK